MVEEGGFVEEERLVGTVQVWWEREVDGERNVGGERRVGGRRMADG